MLDSPASSSTFIESVLKVVTARDILIALSSVVVGILAGWLINSYYSKKTTLDVGELLKRHKKIPIRPLVEMLKRVDGEFSPDSIKQMTERAYAEEDKELLEKALFLGSLSKMNDMQDCFIGFLELSNYSPRLFKMHLPYLVAKLVTSNPTSSAFLLSLLIEKLG